MMHPEITGFVLAGGKSSRMGTDKATISLQGHTLLERALEILWQICGNVAILGKPELFGSLGTVYPDIFPDCGPLGGIHVALTNSQTKFNLIIAVDTPFLSPQFLSYMAERAVASDSTVTTPEINGYVQPLCSVYSHDFLLIAHQALQSGNYKIAPLFPKDNTLVIKEPELRQFAFTPDMFENLNTPDDLARAQRRFTGHDK